MVLIWIYHLNVIWCACVWYCYATELHAHDFVIKRGVICGRLCIYRSSLCYIFVDPLLYDRKMSLGHPPSCQPTFILQVLQVHSCCPAAPFHPHAWASAASAGHEAAPACEFLGISYPGNMTSTHIRYLLRIIPQTGESVCLQLKSGAPPAGFVGFSAPDSLPMSQARYFSRSISRLETQAWAGLQSDNWDRTAPGHNFLFSESEMIIGL